MRLVQPMAWRIGVTRLCPCCPALPLSRRWTARAKLAAGPARGRTRRADSNSCQHRNACFAKLRSAFAHPAGRLSAAGAKSKPRVADHIARPAHRVQQRLGEAFVDLGAQPRYVHVDDVCLRIEMIIPDVFQE